MVDKAWWIKKLLIQWETKEKNLKINLMKNLLTQWETEKENWKIGGNAPLIDRKHSSNMLLIDRQRSGNILLIDRERKIGRQC